MTIRKQLIVYVKIIPILTNNETQDPKQRPIEAPIELRKGERSPQAFRRRQVPVIVLAASSMQLLAFKDDLVIIYLLMSAFVFICFLSEGLFRSKLFWAKPSL
jgi:hypothetical protein